MTPAKVIDSNKHYDIVNKLHVCCGESQFVYICKAHGESQGCYFCNFDYDQPCTCEAVNKR